MVCMRFSFFILFVIRQKHLSFLRELPFYYHSINVAPQESPAPNPASTIFCPFFSTPDCFSSASRIGILAEEVFHTPEGSLEFFYCKSKPPCNCLYNSLIRLMQDKVINIFRCKPSFSNNSLIHRGTCRTANLKYRLPSI